MHLSLGHARWSCDGFSALRRGPAHGQDAVVWRVRSKVRVGLRKFGAAIRLAVP